MSDQVNDYLEEGYEPLRPYLGHEPYLYLGGRKIETRETIEVAREGLPPVRCQVVAINQIVGCVVVELEVMRSSGPFGVRFTLSAGTLVRRPNRKER